MMEFGKSLRIAREAKGYTVAQLAESTRLAPSVVENLENEDFSRIAAPIYGRGFVKLYCEAVGLEPKPFVDEFMEIVNGNRETHIREREPVRQEEVPAGEASAPVPEAVPKPAAEPPRPETDLFHPESESAVPPAPAAVGPETRPNPDTPTISRYAAPFRTTKDVFLPSSWRIVALVLAAAVLLALVLLGVRALYRATAAADTGSDKAAAAPQAAVSKPAAPQAAVTKSAAPQAAVTKSAAPQEKSAAPRAPQKIPSLYFDN